MKKKVLIVEDTDVALIIFKTMLEQKYAVCTASGYQDFTNVFSAENPDLVLSDLGLEDGRGTDVRDWLQQKGLNVPIILVSGNLNDLPSEEWHGFSAYLQKPVPQKKILETVELAIISNSR